MSVLKIEDFKFSPSSIEWDYSHEASDKPVKKEASRRVRISGLHQLAGFEFVSDDKLVRVSQKDFWKLDQDDSGYFIERLVDDDAGPVKF